MTPGSATLALPADTRRVVTIKCVDTRNKLDPMEITEFEREIGDAEATGPPSLYFMTAPNEVSIYKVPDAPYTMRVFYIKDIARMDSDTDEPDLPVSLHYAVVQAASVVALQAENEEERAQTAESEFENTIARAWRGLSGAASGDEPRTVTDVMGYTGGY
jgi:hypothetical protein